MIKLCPTIRNVTGGTSLGWGQFGVRQCRTVLAAEGNGTSLLGSHKASTKVRTLETCRLQARHDKSAAGTLLRLCLCLAIRRSGDCIAAIRRCLSDGEILHSHIFLPRRLVSRCSFPRWEGSSSTRMTSACHMAHATDMIAWRCEVLMS